MDIDGWKIGNVKIPPGACLAPMAGVTDMPMRLLCFEQGASYAVTEMVSAKGYLFSPENSRAIGELLRHSPKEGLLGLQLFGSEPKYVAEAAKRLSNQGFQLIDINMGCPAHRIVANGEGSALMKHPDLAGEIVYAAVRASGVPVTVKMRSGWDEYSQNAPELARVLEQAGAAAITVHARTRVQQYSGRADWSVIRRVKESVLIPVIGNGDVKSYSDYARMRRETGCDGVAIGRGAQGNPWIFQEILAGLKGEAWRTPTYRERIDMALRHGRMQFEFIGDRGAALEMRKHMIWYLQGLPGCARVREQLTHITSIEEMSRLLHEYASRLAEREAYEKADHAFKEGE